jgi:DNA-binding MarR family transcriptional regulator
MTAGLSLAGRIPIERLLHGAARSFDVELTARLRARGYTDIRRAHGAVFANIDDTGTRPSELARRAGMTRPSMTELIADLDAKGYVTRRPEEGDARSRVVLLTRRGFRHRADAREIIAEMERLYAKRLGRSQLASLRDALARIESFGEPQPDL